jgi:hypothetical protein
MQTVSQIAHTRFLPRFYQFSTHIPTTGSVLLAKEKNEQQGMTDKLKLENVIKWK